jgi:hypothetical protein
MGRLTLAARKIESRIAAHGFRDDAIDLLTT